MPNDEHPDTPRVNAAARAALERVLDHLYCDEETSALAAKRTGDSGYEGEANAFGAAYTLLKEALATFEDTGDAEGRADALGRMDFDVWCWRCDECAEYPEVSTIGEWRWTGTAYEHAHPEAQAHMPATCFGKWRDAEASDA